MKEFSMPLSTDNCFTVADWRSFYGITFTPDQIAAVSDFPWSEATLNSACPFHKDKTIRETHFAFVGLDTVSILELQRLNPEATEPRFYDYAPSSWYSNEKFATEVKLGFHWYLLLKDIVPGSENKTFGEQAAILPAEYEVPTAVVETTKDFLHHKKTGQYVNANRYARTTDLVSDGNRVDVGGCDSNGVSVDLCRGDLRRDLVGVGASRKLPQK